MVLEVTRGMRCLLLVLLVAGCRPPGYGKAPPPDAAEATGDAPGATADAVLDASAGVCDHAFRLDGHATAASVWLTGSFVDWAVDPAAGAIALVLGTDGAWTGSYAFSAGTHPYKFIVDGSEWILDPTNPNSADDGMGHTNSVYTCVP